MQNSIETRGNLCTELEPPVSFVVKTYFHSPHQFPGRRRINLNRGGKFNF